jgi:hypothetical protein
VCGVVFDGGCGCHIFWPYMPDPDIGGIYEKMAKLGLRYFFKAITVLETS